MTFSQAWFCDWPSCKMSWRQDRKDKTEDWKEAALEGWRFRLNRLHLCWSHDAKINDDPMHVPLYGARWADDVVRVYDDVENLLFADGWWCANYRVAQWWQCSCGWKDDDEHGMRDDGGAAAFGQWFRHRVEIQVDNAAIIEV